MLILNRKNHEMIMIGDNIKITVLKLDDISVRLGISAPRDIPVHRIEVYTRIQLQKIKNVYESISQPLTEHRAW